MANRCFPFSNIVGFPNKRAGLYLFSLVGLLTCWQTGLSASPDPMHYCPSIPSDLLRLHCYDQLLQQPKNHSEPNNQKGQKEKETRANPFGKWQRDIQKSLMDDSDIVLFRLNADHLVEGLYGRPKQPALFISCKEGRVSLWVRFGTYVSDFYSGGKVFYRIDHGPQKEIEMRTSKDNRALGLWSGETAAPFIRSLFDASKLALRASPLNGYEVTISFDLRGINLVSKTIEKACPNSVQLDL